jgi:hypothetical protein
MFAVLIYSDVSQNRKVKWSYIEDKQVNSRVKKSYAIYILLLLKDDNNFFRKTLDFAKEAVLGYHCILLAMASSEFRILLD